MSRATQLREYWESVIPHARSFLLADAARYTAGIASRRTLQRRVADGTLPAQGGNDRAIKHARVLRQDLIEFICSLDSLTGREPPPPKPPPRRQPKPKRRTRSKSSPKPRQRFEQLSILD